MIQFFKKTEYIEYNNYKKMIDKMDDIYFMNYVAKKQMKA